MGTESRLTITASDLRIDARVPLAALASLVDNRLQRMADTLELLAMTGEGQSGEWLQLKPLLIRLEQQSLPGDVLYLHPDGSYFTVKEGLAPYNAGDRAYFQRAMAGQVVIGDLIVGRSSGAKDVVVAVPIRSGQTIKGILGATIYLEEMSEWVRQAMRLPSGLLFYALDPQGEATIHLRTERIFQFPTQLGSPSLKQAVEEMLTRPEGAAEYEFEGSRRKVVYQASPLTGWRYVLGEILPIP